jgi:hypothetical protein
MNQQSPKPNSPVVDDVRIPSPSKFFARNTSSRGASRFFDGCPPNGPKGRDNIAQGAALGFNWNYASGPKGRDKVPVKNEMRPSSLHPYESLDSPPANR